MQELSQFISNIGFPIAACVVLFYQQIELTKTINELSNTLKGIDVRLDLLEKKEEKK